MSGRKKVVVVGAGFAGLALCQALEKDATPVDVTIVDRHSYNTFEPLLYQVATAGLNPGDIAYPVRAYVGGRAGFHFRKDDVVAVDFDTRTVVTADGAPLEYDYLVLAAGAGTTYFGVTGAAEHSKAIYTMEDAVAVRDAVSGAVERAASHGQTPGDLTTVIVGGGATGVEMAGALSELRSMEFATYYRELDASMSRIIVVEQLDRLLGAFHPKLGDYAGDVLGRKGVELRLGEGVAEIAPDHVVLKSGEEIPCGLVIWAAGVGPAPITERLDVPKVKGRVEVGPDLRVLGREDVFAIGDMAGASGPGSGGGLLPQLAQPAIQEGRHVAGQLRRLVAEEALVGFSYRDKGVMATIGRRAAVAQLPGGLRLRGTLGWLAWLGLHIVYLTGVRNRSSVLLNWAWRYVSWRRGPRVITGG